MQKKVSKQMVLNKVCSSNAATFRKLLDGLCQRRDFETGLDVFTDSLKQNRVPDFTTLRMFVEGLVYYLIIIRYLFFLRILLISMVELIVYLDIFLDLENLICLNFRHFSCVNFV